MRQSWKNFFSVIILFASQFLLTTCTSNDHDFYVQGTFCMGPNDPDHCDWGHPNKLDLTAIPVADNEVNVAFGIITDTHVEALTSRDAPAGCVIIGQTSYYNDTSQKMRNNRSTIPDINQDCSKAGAVGVDCLGIVHIGDLVNDRKTQQLLGFRQLYEHDYPGGGGGTVYSSDCIVDHDAYSLGHRIKYPVIPLLGNHDVTEHYQDQNSETGGYIIQRFSDAIGLLDQYPNYIDPANQSRNPTNFIWRWGQYVFVTLGMSAGSYNWQTQATDPNKLLWLKESMAKYVNDSTLGVLIFQHYGWDSSSKNWWTDYERDMMINILCRRNDKNQVCQPHNVLGIFTGHNHWPQQWIPIDAGKDTHGDDVRFWDFSMMTTGFDTNDGTYGFSVVKLTGDYMYIHTKARNYKTGYNQYWPTTCYKISTTGPATPCTCP